MLNSIWAGLIIISIVFATGHDIHDELNNSYNNGHIYHLPYSSLKDTTTIRLHHHGYYFDAQIETGSEPDELLIPITEALPDSWHIIAQHQTSADTQQLRATLLSIDRHQQQLSFILPEVHWVKLHAIVNAAFDMAEFAVKLAIGLAGIMALWLGLMQIAEKSGLMLIFVKAIYPLLRWLFPDIPKDHPAMGSISLNMAANILGLGNAATPLGIKAMQQLQTLNQKKDQASDAMCMFLALNTSSVQLLPPVTLIALMGAGVSELILPIILATSTSTLVAVISARWLARRSR